MTARTAFPLYLITDRKLFRDEAAMLAAVEQALRGGVRAVQLREKDLAPRPLLDLAFRVRDVTSRSGALLFVNDRADIAMAVGADGVHLGGESMPARAARKAASGKMLVGVSAHSVEQAEQAEREGADFITLGPIYPTPSKMRYGPPLGPALLGEVKRRISLPLYAIGGITKDRIADVKAAGADGVAVISAILRAENVEDYTRECLRALQ